jgi:protein TonB
MNRLSSQSKRDIKALFITILLYTPILFWWQSSHLGVPKETTQTILIDIQNFQSKEEIAPKEEPIVEEKQSLIEERLIDDEVLDEIDELMKEPPAIEPQPLTTKPKPIIKERPTPKKIVKKKSIKKAKKTKKVTKREAHKRVSTKKRLSKGEQSRFLTKVKRAINSHKVYPKMAKKRGMQGRVKVSFTVTSSGGVSNIKIRGSKLFIKTTKRAINSAFPMDTRGVALPITLNLTINYKLNRG